MKSLFKKSKGLLSLCTILLVSACGGDGFKSTLSSTEETGASYMEFTEFAAQSSRCDVDAKRHDGTTLREEKGLSPEDITRDLYFLVTDSDPRYTKIFEFSRSSALHMFKGRFANARDRWNPQNVRARLAHLKGLKDKSALEKLSDGLKKFVNVRVLRRAKMSDYPTEEQVNQETKQLEDLKMLSETDVIRPIRVDYRIRSIRIDDHYQSAALKDPETGIEWVDVPAAGHKFIGQYKIESFHYEPIDASHPLVSKRNDSEGMEYYVAMAGFLDNSGELLVRPVALVTVGPSDPESAMTFTFTKVYQESSEESGDKEFVWKSISVPYKAHFDLSVFGGCFTHILELPELPEAFAKDAGSQMEVLKTSKSTFYDFPW